MDTEALLASFKKLPVNQQAELLAQFDAAAPGTLAKAKAEADAQLRAQAEAEAEAAFEAERHHAALRRAGKAGFGWAVTVSDFSAFRNVRTMPEVAAACAADLEHVGVLQMAIGRRLGWLPAWRGKTLMASLSACGVLCAGGCVKDNALPLAHLPSKRIAMIKCGSGWVHGFVYNSELYVAQEGHAALWHAPITEVFTGRTDLSAFEQFPLVARWGLAPSLDAAARGFVVVANYDNPAQHMVVDLAAHTSRLIEVGRKLRYLGGTTGIVVPGVAWVAGDGDFSPVFAVAYDGTTREIANEMWTLPTMLPSAGEPADLARAAILDWRANVVVGDTHGKLTEPAQPAWHSLVRLYHDVFLLWDTEQRVWITARIIVP